MSSSARTAYTPVQKNETDGRDRRGRGSRRNPFERDTFLGRSIVFWVLATILVSVIVSVVLTISFVLTMIPHGAEQNKTLVGGGGCMNFESFRNQSFDEEVLANSCNDFGMRLVESITRRELNNMIISPFSVFSVLAQVLLGAKGYTAVELRSVLEVPCEDELEWLSILKKMTSELTRQENHGDSQTFILKAVNRLFLDSDYNGVSDFLGRYDKHFGPNLKRLNFNRTEEAREQINKWAENETNGKITDILSPCSINHDTRLVLANAVYFKAAWKYPFDSKKTSQRDFHLINGGKVSTNMMEVVGDFFSRRDDDLDSEVLVLPFSGDDAYMIVVLPDEGVSLEKVIKTIEVFKDNDNDITLVRSNDTKRTLVRLPKFQFRSRYELKSYLYDIGLRQLFEAGADISGIMGKVGHPVDEIFQKAYIDVNEDGCEAAAVTVAISKTALVEDAVEKEISFDRPFIYFIEDANTELDLFVGTVVNPNPRGTVRH